MISVCASLNTITPVSTVAIQGLTGSNKTPPKFIPQFCDIYKQLPWLTLTLLMGDSKDVAPQGKVHTQQTGSPNRKHTVTTDLFVPGREAGLVCKNKP